MFGSNTPLMPQAADTLPGRAQSVFTGGLHHVNGRKLTMDIPENMQVAVFGMGCYWGVERLFWSLPGVWLTMVGNAGGSSPNPTYEEVCSGKTGHAEVVRLVFDSTEITYETLLKLFWEGHDPTQGMRQGNDRGTQYRSAIYTTSAAQLDAAKASRDRFQPELTARRYGEISTEIKPLPEFYMAEAYHQQYLSKNPAGYCGIGGTGVVCPIGTAGGAA